MRTISSALRQATFGQGRIHLQRAIGGSQSRSRQDTDQRVNSIVRTYTESPEAALPPAPQMQRAYGRGEVSFRRSGDQTVLDRLYQEGQAKVRLPKTHGATPVAVFLNTAGGVTGGDLVLSRVDWGAGTTATITSQAAERIYKSSGAIGRIETTLQVSTGATAEWLPQETILFDRARLCRHITADIAGDARLLLVETTVFGRSAMGEIVRQCELADHWRIRRDGRLIYADTLKIGGLGFEERLGSVETILKGTATGSGATALATILLVAPDAESKLDAMRDLLERVSSEAGASAWNGMLVARLISPSARDLRRDLVTVLEAFRGNELPRPWYC
jgi:urease accessory protein